ncbi:MAG: potassium-transporting ATPase subunit KdpB [Chthoniobacterales bacterium]|nr:potassium-transporting ATPase subunit KdpB [Chthoniobacterales bacterium]
MHQPSRGQTSFLDPELLRRAMIESFRKLDPRHLLRNPVVFLVWLGSLVTTGFAIFDFSPFTLQLALWLWFTVLFANFAEAAAEGRGKAQAAALRKLRTTTVARKLAAEGAEERVNATGLHRGDRVVCEAGDTIPCDGDVIEGIATVDESAITGESAPVIRESGGDRCAVTGGTHVLSDRIVIEICNEPGDSFLDRMIGMVESAKRQATPNEKALGLLLLSLTAVFLLVVATLPAFVAYARSQGGGDTIPVPILIALLVCLIPTTIGALLSAIGISGIDRLTRRNVMAMSGRAVEAAGDIDVLLLDKTGTITLGNREAVAFLPAPGIDGGRLAENAQLASLADETPEGRSIVVLAKETHGFRGRDLSEARFRFIPFTAQTRMSGVDSSADGRRIRKGAADAVAAWVRGQGGNVPGEVLQAAESVSKSGGTPLLVAENGTILGVIHLKDIVKGGIRERFALLRKMGIRTVMVTGDNPLTAAAIAAEAGVDDFMASATPEDKLARITAEQKAGHLVAMTGDGTNDAPALAQADVGVAMNTGTQAAREAGNMVDLDSNPTKLIEVVEIGKQLLMTRGALTTFSLANDVAKYFAILPALFIALYVPAGAPAGPLAAWNIMHLHSPESAILSAVIFNALIIIALIPLALRGVAYPPMPADAMLRRNLLIYGLGGVLVPFLGIKLIDLALVATGLA